MNNIRWVHSVSYPLCLMALCNLLLQGWYLIVDVPHQPLGTLSWKKSHMMSHDPHKLSFMMSHDPHKPLFMMSHDPHKPSFMMSQLGHSQYTPYNKSHITSHNQCFYHIWTYQGKRCSSHTVSIYQTIPVSKTGERKRLIREAH